MKFSDYYRQEVGPQLLKELKLKNLMALPRVEKIVVNVGVGEAVTNKNAIAKVKEQLALITGQKPVETKARVSISAFKIRKGLPIGVKVTLRNKRMYDFLEKLIKIIIPRIRDFRGIDEKNIDRNGNLNLGFTEQTIFPEIEFDKIDKVRGLQVTVVTDAHGFQTGKLLFAKLGIPFKKTHG
ncbi:50S ribosomal protein L5 [Patescibacteria group bacterium]|nr:50S ribosomal protein L5 [Patescibacteria group bacterium]MCL5091680.1 50S ribosomal protein L5 [Patescibacteria group bacterium]